MNVTPEGVNEILKLRDTYNLLSLSDTPADQSPHIERIRSQRYTTFSLPVEDRIILDRALERLAEFEQRVVQLFFFQDLTQTEIARRLGFSQKHISRTIGNVLKKLRHEIT